MSFIEMIGFVITLLAFLVLAVKRTFEERRRRANPEEFEREELEQAERLKAFLKSVDLDMKEYDTPKPVQHAAVKKVHKPQQQKYLPPQRPVSPQRPVPPQTKTGGLTSQIEGRKLELSIEKRKFSTAMQNHYTSPIGLENDISQHRRSEREAYDIKKVDHENRALDAMKRLKSRKDMIIYQEIISPPKALR